MAWRPIVGQYASAIDVETVSMRVNFPGCGEFKVSPGVHVGSRDTGAVLVLTVMQDNPIDASRRGKKVF